MVLKQNKKRRAKGLSSQRNPTFGAVATITTAPTAIGNSLQGFTASVSPVRGGVRVVGRDFSFSASATGTVTGWVLSGGVPLTPCCLPSTILRSYVQMYNEFKINGANFHYITSSSTTATGDVMFYHSKNASAQLPECTNNSFLPYVMSDSGTLLGPQWTNHTLHCNVDDSWYSTDYGADTLNESRYSAGDIFLYSKTSSTESPGYIVFDYDITFRELSVNPRSGILPLAKAQWQQVALVNNTVAVADTTNLLLSSFSTSGIGGTTITAPTVVAGDIYEFVFDSTNSTYGAGSSASTAVMYKPVGAVTPITFKDGLKVYLCIDSSTSIRMYAVLSGALGDRQEFICHQTITYADTYRGYMKYITSNNPATIQSAY